MPENTDTPAGYYVPSEFRWKKRYGVVEVISDHERTHFMKAVSALLDPEELNREEIEAGGRGMRFLEFDGPAQVTYLGDGDFHYFRGYFYEELVKADQ